MGKTQIHVSIIFDGALDASAVFADLILRKYVLVTISYSGQQNKICYNAGGDLKVVSQDLCGNEP